MCAPCWRWAPSPPSGPPPAPHVGRRNLLRRDLRGGVHRPGGVPHAIGGGARPGARRDDRDGHRRDVRQGGGGSRGQGRGRRVGRNGVGHDRRGPPADHGNRDDAGDRPGLRPVRRKPTCRGPGRPPAIWRGPRSCCWRRCRPGCCTRVGWNGRRWPTCLPPAAACSLRTGRGRHDRRGGGGRRLRQAGGPAGGLPHRGDYPPIRLDAYRLAHACLGAGVAEPPPASRLAAPSPRALALEDAVDDVTRLSLRAEQGAPVEPAEIDALTAPIRTLGVTPHGPDHTAALITARRTLPAR